MHFRQGGTSDGTVLSNMETEIADLNRKIKPVRGAKEEWLESGRKAQNVARDYSNGSKRVKGVCKWCRRKKQFKNGVAELKKLWIKRMNVCVNGRSRLSRLTTIWSTQQLSISTNEKSNWKEKNWGRRQKPEAVERAHAEELEFEKKKLESKQLSSNSTTRNYSDS